MGIVVFYMVLLGKLMKNGGFTDWENMEVLLICMGFIEDLDCTFPCLNWTTKTVSL